jgi:hypothetical protein
MKSAGVASLSVRGMRPPPALVSYRHYKERGSFMRQKIIFTPFQNRKYENPALNLSIQHGYMVAQLLSVFHSHKPMDLLNVANN